MKYLKFAFFQISKLILYPYGLIMYPLAFVLRYTIRKNPKLWFPLWIVLDDEEDFGEPFFLFDRKRNFWTSYQWAAIRNNCWNYHSLFEKELWTDQVFPTRRLKWEYKVWDRETGLMKWISGWTVNRGERLSEKYSTLGWDNRTFKVPTPENGMIEVWTISYAGKVGPVLINLKLGWNDLGQQIFEFKVRRYKKYYTEHWENPLH